jgi:hypothetical protein
MGRYAEDSGFLFAHPSFLQGVIAAIDLGATHVEYNTSWTIQEADARAIASDWAITGKDIKAAIQDLVEEKAQKE